MNRAELDKLAKDLLATLRPKMPSVRDLDVFEAVHKQGRRQEEVAEQFGLSQGRVAQICKEVKEVAIREAGLDASPEHFRPYVEIICELARLRRMYEIDGLAPRSQSTLHLIEQAVQLMREILGEVPGPAELPEGTGAGANISLGTCSGTAGGIGLPRRAASTCSAVATAGQHESYVMQ